MPATGLKKLSTNIPSDLLEEATRLTGLGQTQTLIEGLRELIAERKRKSLASLRGKIHIDLNLKKIRQTRPL